MQSIYFLILFIMTTAAYTPDAPSVKKKITIAAKPGPISIETTNTALIVVDMQNDFGVKTGMFDRNGINIDVIRKIIAPTAGVIALAREAGIKIIYLKMGYRDDLSDLGNENSPNRDRHLLFHVGETMTAPDGSKSRILIRDNWGTDIIPELKPMEGDIVIYKTRFSGFYNTNLDATLKQLGIKNLLVTGCTTSVCVESTVRDATFRDYSPIVLEDCTAEPMGNDLPRSNHEASLLNIQAVLGWVTHSDELIKALK
jgi:ureidoacrylate peracid hydrolase